MLGLNLFQHKFPVIEELDSKDEVESLLLTTIRGKCITQLLLLGAIDSIQVLIKFFSNKLHVNGHKC